MQSYKVGILGASGYTATGLIAILRKHRQLQLSCLASRRLQGSKLGASLPQYPELADLEFCAPDSAELRACDLVFCATPHAVAMHHARGLWDAGVRIVDLSADFRLQDLQLWQEWYGIEHACPELVLEAVYGLPEFYRERISNAQLVANTGCYACLVQLMLRPLLAAPDGARALALDSIVVDAKSGASGAGKKLAENLLFCELAENFAPYASSGHRHIAEIKESLQSLGGSDWDMVFLPHLIPMIQGMQASAYIPIREQLDFAQIYADFYADELFVNVLPAGQHPHTSAVRGSNQCLLALSQQNERLIVMGVIDNLGKGACGQAVQNANLMLGFPEQEAL